MYLLKKRFYGPQERWLPIWQGFLRFSTYKNLYDAKKAGFKGDLVSVIKFFYKQFFRMARDVCWEVKFLVFYLEF